MNMCKTCGHWKRNNGKYDSVRMGLCDSDKWECDGEDLVDGVSYTDHDGYMASVETGEEFGCIHHTSNAEVTRIETDKQRNESTGEVGAVFMSPSTSLFDTERFHKIATDVEHEYGMGGLCGTVYEEWAMDICKLYVSNKELSTNSNNQTVATEQEGR